MDEMSNRSRFMPDDEWHPEPQTDGRLGPPGRKPPTAIATATPRPPRHPSRPGRYARLTVMQRAARGMLSVLLIGSGALAISVLGPIVGIVSGLVVGGLGVVVGVRLIRRSRHRRHISFEARRTRRRLGDSSDPTAQSA